MITSSCARAKQGGRRAAEPAGPFQVEIDLPPGRVPLTTKLLVAGRIVAFARRRGGVTVQVPKVGLHEVVAVDLA